MDHYKNRLPIKSNPLQRHIKQFHSISKDPLSQRTNLCQSSNMQMSQQCTFFVRNFVRIQVSKTNKVSSPILCKSVAVCGFQSDIIVLKQISDPLLFSDCFHICSCHGPLQLIIRFGITLLLMAYGNLWFLTSTPYIGLTCKEVAYMYLILFKI